LSTPENTTQIVLLQPGRRRGLFSFNISAFLTKRRHVAKKGNVFTATATRVLNIILQIHYKQQTVNAV